MSDVALIRNPNSTGNRALPGDSRDTLPSAVKAIDCSSLADLSRSLREARAAGAEVLLIDGGDGTVREVLSRLPDIWGAALPRVGIFPRGNTNLIAREVGALGTADAVAEILRRRDAGTEIPVRRRAILRVDYPSGEHAPLRGFMLGWGAYAAGTRIAREEIAAAGPRQVAMAVFATLRRALFGAERRALRRGVATRLVIDGAEAERGARFIGLATTLRGPLVAGLNPFWGVGGGPIRWLDVRAPGRWLILAGPATLRGRPWGWMKRVGYASGCATRLELDLDTPFIMDGEIFPPPRAGPLGLSADEEVEFISL